MASFSTPAKGTAGTSKQIERRCRATDRCTPANTEWRWRERVVVDFNSDRESEGEMVGVINAFSNPSKSWHRGVGPS